MNTIIDRENIVNLLLSTLETHFDEINESVDLSERENIKLFGGDGILDAW